MSTLTKVLIVLQVVFSILLCGVVVSYVASANNYETLYTQEKDAARDAESKMRRMENEWKEFEETKLKDLETAQAQVTDLETQITTLNSKIADLELEKTSLMKDIDKWASAANASSLSAKQQTTLFEQTNTQLEELKKEQSSLYRRLKETDDTLVEKMAIIDQQNEQIRLLTEQKSDLSTQVDDLLKNKGKYVVSNPPPFAPTSEVTSNLDLKGLVTAVDLKEKLALISIGSNHGVRQNMTFHVMRGNQFVCDIRVIEVDAERAVGTIGMGQADPRSGDIVATNL